ncbi:tRNA threonylcarbamoyladenosine dehydratase [Clostridium tyrobutyricum]|uniref:CsdL (EC-YgdL) protein of the HesA/MoeB/ThiF family, part of the CsdA-E-L sulfur transfer pathway n=1 Tax=Clostridium tyrobutyricum DIVETGP TaxID=1408889 RepID=W6NEL8_CLOTY|nr:tRNA threonylcarbamoyladenosine dehydratase [Clostridium tyrobutyricum]AND84792.1 molybdopterin/thiamine biosynthesis protein [Clostridium tyrobutyricum]ANP69379.1 tRNA threonylcarbamoyladenosine dehydratase [Clostridium tyrobutyricum]MBR9647680.1 tRNA threonylcarbamoyladenosine dehydratase [Clostridium tyrobutyricum]MBV4415974.1 tRNA threonylcarbamoyladenosine dehydratase [Clostridium tyrobutyricum]MBV4422084.1 tRNA threonylcarbamoyladenosine dehydratase [Clostridium tyrobutyricum]
MKQHLFSRTELLIGKNALKKLQESTVVIFGLGGVGSFSLEAVARGGIGHIVIVDDDTVCLTNINRQIQANFKTIGKPKVQVLKERILDINPNCNIETYQTFVREDNIDSIIPKNTNYVIDAIDTISSKISLIMWCKAHNIDIISCMGTGNKLDPTMFKIEDIYKTKICPLAKVMRRELKKRGIKNLKVLYSEEIPQKPKIDEVVTCREGCVCVGGSKKCLAKRQIPASISFVPPVAGMIIGGEVIKSIIDKK